MTTSPTSPEQAGERIEMAGMVLVPREPTEAMIEAGTQAEWEAVFTGDYRDPDPEDVSRASCREGAIVAYRAMVSAAALTPAPADDVAGRPAEGLIDALMVAMFADLTAGRLIEPSEATKDAREALEAHAASLTRQLADRDAEVERLRKVETSAKAALKAIDDLISDSEGVYGLHRNGDPAMWSEITEGGRFEEWLLPVEDLRAQIAATPAQTVDGGASDHG